MSDEAPSTPPVAADLSPSASTWWSRLKSQFWVLPLVIIVLSWLLALLLPELDHRFAGSVPYVFSGGPESARGLLSTIATAMISVTGLVFSITMVVLQLASSQFTPRILSTFLANRISQVTLGIFAATFVFALNVLRVVRSGERQFVPQMSVTAAFLLVIASIVMFIAFIDHITSSVQVSQVISRLGDSTMKVVDRNYVDTAAPTHPRPTGPGEAVRLRDKHGRVTAVDLRALVELARELDGTLVLLARPGDSITAGQELARWHARGDRGRPDDKQICSHVWLQTDRTLDFDPAFGLRQLVDISSRALSPGLNDPTTAVECLDEIHRRQAPTVRERLVALLDDLDSCALPQHRDVLRTLRASL